MIKLSHLRGERCRAPLHQLWQGGETLGQGRTSPGLLQIPFPNSPSLPRAKVLLLTLGVQGSPVKDLDKRSVSGTGCPSNIFIISFDFASFSSLLKHKDHQSETWVRDQSVKLVVSQISSKLVLILDPSPHT